MVSLVLIFSGIYIVGPWYIPVVDGMNQPVHNMFNGNTARIFGGLQLIVGLVLCVWTFLRTGKQAWIDFIIFLAFTIRLFTTIGVFIALDGKWLPPSYLSQVAIVGILGAYWLYLKKREPQ